MESVTEKSDVQSAVERLYIAAHGGDAGSIGKILEEHPDILKTRHSSNVSMSKTLLHAAVEGGNVDCCKIISKEGRKLTREADARGFTPLHLAVFNGQSNIVKVLLSYAHYNNCFDPVDGMMPIHLAAVQGNIWVLQELLQHDHFNDRTDNERHCRQCLRATTHKGDNPIHLCIKHDQLKALQVLVDYAIRRNDLEVLTSGDQEGNTPMHIAVIHKRDKMVHYLLSKIRQGGMHSLNINGLTPMQCWENFGQIDDFRSKVIGDMLSNVISNNPNVLPPYDGEKRVDNENLPWFQRGIFSVFAYDEQWIKEMGGKVLTMTSIVVGACMLIGATLLGLKDTVPVSESIHADRRDLLHSISISGLLALVMVHTYLVIGIHLWANKAWLFIMTVLMSALTVFMGLSLFELLLLASGWELSWDVSVYRYVFWGWVTLVFLVLVLRSINFVME